MNSMISDELLPKARRGVKFKNDTGRSLFLVGTFQIDETRDDWYKFTFMKQYKYK